MWYITQSKPQFRHMKAQLNQDCIRIQRTATKDFRRACTEAVDFTQIELAKMATIECNKLNNTSQKIMVEQKKAEEVTKKLKSLHDVCSRVVTAMSTATSGMATKVELAEDVVKLNARIDSKSDHLQQLLHPIKNAVESMQQGLVPMDTEINELKRIVVNLKQQTGPMTTEQTNPV